MKHFDNLEPRAKRHVLCLNVTAHIDDVLLGEVLIRDLSSDGLLMETEMSLRCGSVLTFDLPHGVAAKARIVWSSGPFFGCNLLESLGDDVMRAILDSNPAALSAREADIAGKHVTFGEVILRTRMAHGLSTEEFGERVGVSRQSVWYWETGQRRPRPQQLRRLNEQFGIEWESFPAIGASAAKNYNNQIELCKRLLATSLGVEGDQVRISIDW